MGDNEDFLVDSKSMKNIEANHLREKSLWKYFWVELTRGYLLDHDEEKYAQKCERVYTFMKIPKELEKFMLFGFCQCLDAFLYVFTFLPLRFVMALVKFFFKGAQSLCSPPRGVILEPAEICDLLKGVILIVCCFAMMYIDVSMIYHIVRGQAIIKLYIFFNMLEVADRLFSSFGQDILDSLFWTSTEQRSKRRHHVGLLPHLLLAIVYVSLHAFLVLLQATTLNVAFNSHNKALLTIMMSNNFVELKGSVFKKFEKNNLFQMSCSDVRERIHFLVLLAIVCVRNLTDFNWNLDHFYELVPDMVLVMISEVLVDWVKHAFITKFNNIPDEVYKEYTVSIAYDMAHSRQPHTLADNLDVISRRMGFIPLPIAVLLVRVLGPSLGSFDYFTVFLLILLFICLTMLKVLNSIVLLGKSCEYLNDNKAVPKFDEKQSKSEPTSPKRSKSKEDLPTYASNMEGEPENLSHLEIKRSHSLVIDRPPMMKISGEDIKPKSPNTPVSPDNMLQVTMSKALLSNSTVSLASVELNSEFIKDINAQSTPIAYIGEKSLDNSSEKETELKRRVPKPLDDIDRYTMCSNRIV